VVKLRVSQAVGTTVTEMNGLLRAYWSFTTVHKWVQDVVKKGEPLPKNEEEMVTRMRQTPPKQDYRVLRYLRGGRK